MEPHEGEISNPSTERMAETNNTNERESELSRPSTSHDINTTNAGTKNHNETLDQQFENLANQIFTRLNSGTIGNSRYYIADIFNGPDSEAIASILRLLDTARKRHGGLIFITCVEGDHIHVVHDCSFYGSCRCWWARSIEAEAYLRKHRYQPIKIGKIEKNTWYTILLYYYKGGNSKLQIILEGEEIRLPTPTSVMGRSGIGECPGCQRILVESFTENNHPIYCQHTSGQNNKRAREAIDDIENKAKRNRKEIVKSYRITLQEMFLKIPCSPINNIVSQIEYLNNPILASKRQNDKDFLNEVDAWQARINKWSLHDFYTLYTNGDCKPYWQAKDLSVEQTYLNREQSVDVLNRLLLYQYNNDKARIKMFLEDLMYTLERLIPKRNCLVILSPPNAGKNWFVESVLSYYLNVGQIPRIINRTDSFPFQDVCNKRVAFWDEPHYEKDAVNHLLNLFAGNCFAANVKHKDCVVISVTPIIVCTNDESLSFFSIEAFKSRIVVERWKPCPFLRNITRKPLPLAYYDLLQLYNVNTDLNYIRELNNTYNIND